MIPLAQLFLHAHLQRVEKLKEYNNSLYDQLVNNPSYNISIIRAVDEFLLTSYSVINWMTKFQDIINIGIWNAAYPEYLLNKVSSEGEHNPYFDITPAIYFENARKSDLMFYSLFGCLSLADEERASIRLK